uniref:Integrator complex subunit 4 n=1 Tax=Phallusia mammillata TaxID=59560 RepID=A0A6F9DFG0_9ASCI|nr:integrator complex subunit 4 [Phallusia mammillata]
MAVHLKKRAYEEFSHVIQEPARPQIKKLRLTKPSGTSSTAKYEEYELNLDGRSSTEVLAILMEFSRKFPVPAEYVQQCLESLIKHFHNERETAVRTKIAWLLGQLCSTIGYYPQAAVEKIIDLLNIEVSGKVLSQLWSSILSIALRLPQSFSVHEKLITMASSSLSNHHQEVRCQCLNVIGNLATTKSTIKLASEKRWDEANVHTLVADYFDDPEPRVRTSSLQALILMHQRGEQLEFSVYEQACSSLNDDYEQVRFTAAQLVWILSHIYPENYIKAPFSDDRMRLIDDAFAKICNMFNDSSYKVRAEAARLLGSMHLVSDNFLFQTLDKKLMSDLRKKKSLNEQAKERFVEEFSTGARWGEDAPRESAPDANNLMNSGACGAFVHGLEDEMMEVRMAAVDSLTELASQRSSPSFAQAALDFLVDCLNDEIEAVRLNAVNSLHKIVEHVTILEDQLDNVHSAMEDAAQEIREGIHHLLSSCSLMSKACLFDTVLMLLKNLNKYPQDRRSIWSTQQKLGEHHCNLVYSLVPQLLSCHPYFDTAEPQMDDPSYIAILILIFNAAKLCPSMTQLFPEHVIRHYQYLRDSIPDLVPQHLKLTTFTAGVDLCLQSPPRNSDINSDPNSFLERAMARIKHLQTHDSATQKSLLDSTIRDLRHAAKVAPSLASTAQCSADFLQAQLLLSKAVDAKGWAGSTHMSAQHLAFAKPAASQIIQLANDLEHLYLGLSSEEIALVKQIRFKAQALLFVLEMQEITHTRKGKISPTKLCEDFFSLVQEMKTYLNDRNITPDSFSRTCFNELLKLSSTRKSSLVVKLLQPLLMNYSVSTVSLNNKVIRSKVTVHEPQTNLDSPIVISAGLAASLHVDITTENLSNPLRELRIKVIYPDSKEQLFALLPTDVKQTKPFTHHIKSKVYLSNTQWTDSCAIKLAFVKVFPDNNISSVLNESGSSQSSQSVGQVLITKPVEVLFQPKPPTRV